MVINRIPEFQPEVPFVEKCRRISVRMEICATRDLRDSVRQYQDKKFRAGETWDIGNSPHPGLPAFNRGE